MHSITTLALAGFAALVAFAGSDTTAKSNVPLKKTQVQTSKSTAKALPSAAPKTSSAKTTPATTTVSKKSYPKAAPKPAAVRYRSAQQQPTSDRYKEIQQALSEKGYFSGPADGAWGADSVEALKRFQRDQNLTDDGKIGSLSLIALGLGPKRQASANPPPADKIAP